MTSAINNTQECFTADGSSSAIGPYVAVVRSTASESTCTLPAAANALALGIAIDRSETATHNMSVVRHGRTKALLAGTVTRGDRLNVNGTTGALKRAAATGAITSGANTSLDYVAKSAYYGKRIWVEYRDPKIVSFTGEIQVIDDSHIIALLTTNGGGTITETADSLKILIAAHTQANAMVTVTDTSGHDGSGTLTAEIATELAGGGNSFCIAEESGVSGDYIRIFVDKAEG
jgi:hypothetical protein